MLIFLYCRISKLQGGGRITRELKLALVERSSLSNLDLWCVCPVVRAPSVSVQATLAVTTSFSGPLLLGERWRNAKQRPGRAPASEGLRGCCYCYSLWWGLLLPEINDTLGLMRGLTAKTNSQTNSQAGLVRTEERLQNKPRSELAAHTVTQCRWTLYFLGAPCHIPLSRSQSCPQHVFPILSASVATTGNLNPWGARGCVI